MILVDTSIWIDHLRTRNVDLARLLEDRQILSHPHEIGEVLLGSLRDRAVVLQVLQDLPQAVVARDDDVLRFIGQEALFGLGIGYVDAHPLASARLTADARLWSRDRRLVATALRLGVAATPPH